MKKTISILLTGITILSLIFCGCSKKEPDTIKIASKPFTEQYILTEMLAILIEENTDLNTEITKGVGGGTTNIHPAMLTGDFDLYPEYTGTAWVTVLKHEEIPDDETLYENLKTEYENLGLYWSGLYGFSNSYALAVRTEMAEEYNLHTFSDVAAISSDLIFGGNYDYIERADGYPLLCSTYNMSFKDTVDMDIALKYQAMEEKQIDVTNAFTTDAALAVDNVTALEDDLHFFTTYYGGTVVRKEVIDAHPELIEVLELLTGNISVEEMQQMNYEVEINGKDEAVIAREFLQNKGLIQ